MRTRRRKLRALGISETNARRWATWRKGYWRIAESRVLAIALPNGYWTDLGLQDSLVLPPLPGMLSEPPDADPHGRWCGGARVRPGAYPISKSAVWEAYLKVKANKGAVGGDEQSIAEFEEDLHGKPLQAPEPSGWVLR